MSRRGDTGRYGEVWGGGRGEPGSDGEDDAPEYQVRGGDDLWLPAVVAGGSKKWR